MKKEIFVLFAILLLFQWVNGQNNGQRKKTQASATTNQRTNGNRQGTVQKPAVNIPKGYLDTTGVNDFKNNAKPAATNVSERTTNPETNGQNRRTVQQPAAHIPKGYLDTTGVNDFKNNNKPAATNVKGNTTNPQAGNQNQRTVQPNSTPVKQTKLDDLKNPFDSTKKVKPGVQSGQVPAGRKRRVARH
jgi:hypothetical protein